MKLTRYFQSCLLVEESKARVIIDPSGHDSANYDSFGKLDAVLFTHEHADHFDPEFAEKFMAAGVIVYANASTAQQMTTRPEIVEDGQGFEVAGLKIQALEIPHCLMVSGESGPQNTGFLLGEKLFHSGDGVVLDGLRAEIVAVPITGPDISLKDACDFVAQLSAKTAVPVHYDFIGTKPEIFEMFSKNIQPGFETRILEQGQSTEI